MLPDCGTKKDRTVDVAPGNSRPGSFSSSPRYRRDEGGRMRRARESVYPGNSHTGDRVEHLTADQKVPGSNIT